jgi:hypothetical protein
MWVPRDKFFMSIRHLLTEVFGLSVFLVKLHRFFKYLCTSFKVKTAVKRVKSALKKNKCVVIGLQSTGEAMVNEASKHVCITIWILFHFV